MAAKPVAIVTGSNTGIGYQTALGLAKKGYTVVLAVRDLQLGRDAAATINAAARERGGDAVVMHLDNARLQSVRDFAVSFLSKYRHLHALVLNAGISGIGIPKDQRTTIDGFQLVFQVNFLAAFLLTQLLLPRIKETANVAPTAPCRVVLLSSVTHRTVSPLTEPLKWAALIRSPKGFPSSYALSKLACTLYAYHLQASLRQEGVSNVVAVAVNPGAVASDIWRTLPPSMSCWFRPLCMRLFFLNTEQGAQTSIAAASAGEVGGRLLSAGRPWYLTPYWIPASIQSVPIESLALLFDLLGPTKGAKVARSTQASHDPRASRALVEAATAAVAQALGLTGDGA